MTSNNHQDSSILVVDDEASIRETFHFFLTRAGYQTIHTADGFEHALELLRSENFELIISDIILEQSSGIELLKLCRENNIDCPFIVITGFPGVETAAESLRYGAFDYIVKPVDKQTLLRTVRLALQQRRLELRNRQAEAERERYRVFLDTVFKSAGDAIIIVDEKQKIVKINAAAQALFDQLLPGIGPGSDLGTELVNSGFSALRDDLIRVLRTKKEVNEHRFECKTDNDELKILSICASPLVMEEDRKLSGAVIVIRDMSEPSHSPPSRRTRFHRFIGSSEPMQNLYTLIENVGRVDTTVLITGESGTGKELAAEALHQESPRRSRPLIKVDCTALPENLLTSELFGHRKGSFTGADRDRKGLLLQADGGTLFLDEIGEITAMTQLRLLRFLQEQTFYPVGSDSEIVVDTRIITATNVELKKKVEEGSFREDLYFRLKVIDLVLPPLRNRMDDIVMLVNHFIKTYGTALNKTIHGISDNALSLLKSYQWPGNVRELEHLIERAAVLCQGTTITTAELPKDLTRRDREAPDIAVDTEYGNGNGHDAAAAMTGSADLLYAANGEASKILATLARCGGNKAKAARLLNIDRSTLYRRIKELDLDLSLIALE